MHSCPKILGFLCFLRFEGHSGINVTPSGAERTHGSAQRGEFLSCAELSNFRSSFCGALGEAVQHANQQKLGMNTRNVSAQILDPVWRLPHPVCARFPPRFGGWSAWPTERCSSKVEGKSYRKASNACGHELTDTCDRRPNTLNSESIFSCRFLVPL